MLSLPPDDIDRWDSWWSSQEFKWDCVRRYEEVCLPLECIEISVEMDEDLYDKSDSRPPHLQNCWHWAVRIKGVNDRTLFVAVSGQYDECAESCMAREKCKKDAIFYCTRHLPHDLKGALIDAKTAVVNLSEAVSLLGLSEK